mmetsp:Transcript_25435/g.70881  ORF Transcript_25435/g.70881 Transcript_25435/m.70881 type:complete len:326 (+) Transcript_25435:99-1076(+)
MDDIPLNEQTTAAVLMLMNSAHADALLLILKHFKHVLLAGTAELKALDETEMRISWQSSRPEPGREGLSFESVIPYEDENGQELRVATVGECRRAIVGMARIASEALGEQIELPPAAPVGAGAPQASPTGSGTFGRPAPTTAFRTLHDSGKGTGGSTRSNREAMMALMEIMKGKGKGKEDLLDMVAKVKGKGGGAATSTVEAASTLFLGEGNRLGSMEGGAAPAVEDGNDLQRKLPVREVTLDAPTISLRVRLLDRRLIEMVMNHDFTIQEVRTVLEHHHASSFTKTYHLMDVNGFPPKKLTDFGATLEQMGLTKAGSCVECRAV